LLSKNILFRSGTFVLAGMLIGLGPAISQAKPPAGRRVPVGTQMKIRLNDTIDSKAAKHGDHFHATVLTPLKYEECTVDGHLASVKKSGKFTGRTSIAFAFDRIHYRDGAAAPLRGQVVKVYGEESVSKVDEEGHVQSGKRGSQTAKRSGIAGVGGAVIGGIAGGGKGAAIGAAVGAGAGAASVAIQGSKRLKLDAGTEMLMRVTK